MLSVILTACSDDDYKWATVSGDQVYFSSELASTVELSKSASYFNVQISRVKTDDAITVPITAQLAENSNFTVPASVTFQPGEKTAAIKIAYNPENITYGSYEDITLAIGDANYTTDYGYSSYSFKAGATEWVDITTNKSTGLMREDLLTTFFKFNSDNPVWNVKIQKSVINEGMYRIVEPYSDMYQQDVAAGADGETYDTSKEHNWVIDATDPDYVYFGYCKTGLDVGYGEITVTSMAYYYLNSGLTLDQVKAQHPEAFGTLSDGMISMPANSMLISMASYNEGSLYKAGKDGLFAVALPGSVIADYSVSAEYTGRFTDASNNDFANINFTLGEDVASVKYALVASTADVSATVQGIIDGTVKSEEASQTGSVSIGYTESGKYKLVWVVYNAGNEAVGSGSLDLKLKSSNDSSTQETYKDITSGTLTIGAKDCSEVLFGKAIGSILRTDAYGMESVLAQSEQDPTHFRLNPYLPAELYKEGVTPPYLDFSVDADGTITVDSQESNLQGQDSNGSTVEIMISDVVTWMGGPDSENGVALKKMGYNSNYKDGLYSFYVVYHAPTGNGGWAFELDTFEADQLDAPAMAKAIAKAKKVASERTYIMRPRIGKAHNVSLFKGKKGFRILK